MRGLRACAAVLAMAGMASGCGGDGDTGDGGGNGNPASVDEDRMVFDSDRTGTFEIHVMGDDGSDVEQLTDDASYDSWWPRLSPDRQRILFYRTPAGVHDTDYEQTSLWLMDADGSNVRMLRDVGEDGWALQGHGEWSPDGSSLVMFGGPGVPQIYVARADGSRPVRVTDGTGVWLDPSWSPDGTRLTFVGCPALPSDYAEFEVYTAAADGTDTPVAITDDDFRDHDPYFSPDGRRIAWLTQTSAQTPQSWNIRIADADGANQRFVTFNPDINSKPEWFSDDLIYFHRFAYGSGDGWQIYRIQPDGNGMEIVTDGHPGNNEFPDG
jgi:TolB protein